MSNIFSIFKYWTLWKPSSILSLLAAFRPALLWPQRIWSTLSRLLLWLSEYGGYSFGAGTAAQKNKPNAVPGNSCLRNTCVRKFETTAGGFKAPDLFLTSNILLILQLIYRQNFFLPIVIRFRLKPPNSECKGAFIFLFPSISSFAPPSVLLCARLGRWKLLGLSCCFSTASFKEIFLPYISFSFKAVIAALCWHF